MCTIDEGGAIAAIENVANSLGEIRATIARYPGIDLERVAQQLDLINDRCRRRAAHVRILAKEAMVRSPYHIRVTDRAGSFEVPCVDFATCLREGARLAASHPGCLIEAFGENADVRADGGLGGSSRRLRIITLRGA